MRPLSLLGVLLVLIVIVSSAYLRLTQAGLSCRDWPACYGRVNAHAVVEVDAAQRTARIAHRFAASVVGMVLIALLFIAARRRPHLNHQVTLAVAGLLVAAGLATVGAVLSETAAKVPLPAVTMANLMGGFALLVILWSMRISTRMPERDARSASWGVKFLAALALLATICQIALGALVSAKFAALACPAFPLCGADTPDGAFLSSLDPLAKLAVGDDGAIVRPTALASLHWAHRVGAHFVLAFAALLAIALIRMGRRARRLGIAIALLTVLQLASGASAAIAHLPLTVVLAHNLLAALLVAALAAANWQVYFSTTSLVDMPDL